MKGLGSMSTEERMEARAKGYENGLGAMAAPKAAKHDAKWTAEVDASIVSMIKASVSFAKIASINNRWYNHLKESSGITKPPVQPGRSSSITWSADVDASIVSMRGDDISYAKIASELGNGLSKNAIQHRWNRHLKDKLQ